jgi:L-lactate dehydrogenase complex protein LldF
VKPSSHNFKQNAVQALTNAALKQALGGIKHGFVANRARARANLPEFEQLRDEAKGIKEHTLAHLDLYLEAYEAKVIESGGQVHWAATADDARNAILNICRKAGARTVTKGKSMVGEEIAINEHLEAAGMKPVETDLGEYLIQLRKEPPSHIIAPAIHLTREQVEADFRQHHAHLPQDRSLEDASQFVAEARAILREQFLAADVGITGANLLIAETGSSVIVTNEGNGDLTQCLPRIHIVIASIEKIVPNLEDAMTILRVLARSATGQEFSTYTTFSTGPRRPGDPDGPDEYHVVLLDNGRTEMLGSEFHDMLRCIRCGACMNHCPVYGVVGGHTYGWVYPGPMGSVLTPSLIGIDEAGHLPNASTFCGRCEAVCPMRIPLPRLMRHWREREYEKGYTPARYKLGLNLWAYAARHPRLYRTLASFAIPLLSRLAKRQGRIRSFPLAGGWTRHRDLPAPQGKTFQQMWRDRGTAS